MPDCLPSHIWWWWEHISNGFNYRPFKKKKQKFRPLWCRFGCILYWHPASRLIIERHKLKSMIQAHQCRRMFRVSHQIQRIEQQQWWLWINSHVILFLVLFNTRKRIRLELMRCDRRQRQKRHQYYVRESNLLTKLFLCRMHFYCCYNMRTLVVSHALCSCSAKCSNTLDFIGINVRKAMTS